MDELVEHCMRQLSFDGDLGSKASRLRDFTIDFYHHPSRPHPQNPDDAFCAFVWAVLAQQPTVRVGLVPAGVTSEVWIAPQVSARRKAKAKGEEFQPVLPAQLEVIEGAASRTLADLQAEFGDQLRIGIHPDAICTAITGSHIRPPKLSPMVYSTLQVVTRGRENGVTVVQLGHTTGYDQKTCHYLVGQLLSLDLCVKVRRGGVGTHFVIHKYFFERSPSWQAIREEELRAQEGTTAAQTTQPADEDPALNAWHSLDFSPIDARHLSSYPLVRNRIISLLKASKNHMHATTNLLIRIGFAHPTKTDRRFFQSRIREMEAEGLIDRVTAPSSNKKSAGTVKCLRLLQDGKPETNAEGVVVQTGDDDDDEPGNMYVENGVKMNVTLHRQIVDLIQQSGTTGLTLTEISDSLNQFDKRTVELLLARAEKDPPPPHIGDLSIVSLMETAGRERRNRYYSSSNQYTDEDFARVGEFAEFGADIIYDDEKELARYQDDYKGSCKPVKADKRSKKAKAAIKDSGTPAKKPRKRKLQDMEVDRDGAVEAEAAEPRTKRRKTKAAEEKVAETPKEPKRRGRPPKAKANEDAVTPPAPKRRGRPPKIKPPTVVAEPEPRQDLDTPKEAQAVPSPALRRTVSPPAPDIVEETPDRRPRKRARVVASPPPAMRSPAATPITEHIAPEVDVQTISADNTGVADGDVEMSKEHGQASSSSEGVMPPSQTEVPINPALQDTATPAHGTTPVPTPALTTPTMKTSSASTPTPSQYNKSRANLSHLRRENEVFQVIQEMGGIMNVGTKEIYDAHMAILERLHDANEPTSSPRGTRMDKRTLNMIIAHLEDHGRIKMTRGFRDHAYWRAAGHAHRIQLGRNMQMPTKIISRTPSQQTKLLQMERPGNDPAERWSKNSARADQLFDYPTDTNYGFIVPKMTRACTFHLAILAALDKNDSSPYFTYDIPIGLHLSVIAQTVHDEGAKDTLTRNLPPPIHTSLQIGRARCRSRFLDLLDILRQLGLSHKPLISCEPTGDHPADYDEASLEGWNINTPVTAPVYWMYNDLAPVYLWALSEASPPFWKSVSYWSLLEDVALDHDFCASVETVQGAPPSNNIGIARSLRRRVGWGRDYVMTWHQTRYMQKLVDPVTALTPLDSEDPKAIDNIAQVVSAPLYASKERMAAELQKARARRSKQSDTQREEGARAKLAQKVAEEHQRREKAWEEIIQRTAQTARIKAVKDRFLASLGTASPKWEGQLRDAMREAELADKSIIKVRKIAPLKPRPPPPPVVHASVHEKTVQELVAQQGPPLPEEQKKRKREKGEPAPVEEQQKRTRRKRFQWNREYDELALDASAIIRVRCRNLRLDWGAFEQAFPSVPRNTVRQRLQTLKESPGNEAYLKRLEERWSELWAAQRGTDELPDEDPESATNFNLVQHLEYLRRHIDKNALRAGFAATREDETMALPGSLDMLQRDFDVVEEPSPAPTFDFIWSSLVEDEREKRLLREAVTTTPERPPSFEESPVELQLAEAALKMTMGTAHENYNPEDAARLLRGLGEDSVAAATSSLLRRGVLSKLVRDPKKTKPGRLLKISDPNQNAIAGPIHRDVFQDAAALEDLSSTQDTWREWPLVATDGDVASLIQLVSEDKADFEVDTTHAREVWPKIDWNSKKAGQFLYFPAL
ncbi:hypothetical protein BD626DRAFT_613048 [Schizophyllum amplum]|uniref:Transcription factor tau subunit sfc3/Tfc3 C-terminal domain-containing protein n=1 Tax=Schizophyllum amplum TaxID=97359 RepID=A0A550CMI0_9AGAR|nr:hypothetical protein BD626DRAFT_613048 [Auriculariopsis ampla]